MRKFTSLIMTLVMFSAFNAQIVTIGDGVKDDTYLPVAPFFKYSYSQCIYLASEINQSGNIYRIKYKGKPGLDISNTNEWTVYIGHTSQSSVTNGGWIPASDMTQVFSGAISVINNNVQITFTAPFNYNGTDNLVIAVDENQDGYDESSNMFLASDVADNRSLLFRHDNVNPDPSSPPPTSILQKSVANIDLDFNEFICNTPISLTATNITDSSVDLSWTNGGTETNWILEYGALGFTQGSGTTLNVTSKPYTLTGLDAGTSYDFYVKADCGSAGQSEWNGPYTFLTACTPFNPPFFEGFESNYQQDIDIASCITQENVLGAAAWKANSTITSFNRAPRTGSWNAYLRYNNEDWLFIPVKLTAGKSYSVELYARQNGKTGAQIEVSYGETNTAAAMTNSIVGETEIIDGDYQKIIGNFTPTVTKSYYVGIKGKLNNLPYYLSIDDIRVRETPTCLTPEALTVDNITANTADLGWTAKGSETAWVIEYGESGFTQGSGTIINTTTNPHTITGLTPNTKYDFYVKADCGGTDNYSDWSVSLSFKTICVAYSIPYFEGFETGYVHDADVGNCISQQSVSGYLGWRANNTHVNYNRKPRTGQWNAYLSYSNEDWLFIPVQFTAGKSYTIDLYVRQDKTKDAQISISYGKANTVAGMTNEILPETNITNGGYQKVLANFTIAETGVHYIGIKGKLTNIPMHISIDDIRIRETPQCVEPSQLKVTNILSTSAYLVWTAGKDETAWVIEYGETGFAQGSGTIINTTNNPHNLTGLNLSTKYDFYVKADCGGANGQSEWTGPYTFSTTCNPYSIPYFEGFETGYVHDAEISGCIIQESISGNTAWDANDTHVNYNRTPRTGSWNSTLRFSNEDLMYIPVNLEKDVLYNVELYARQDEKSGAQISVSYGKEGVNEAMLNTIVAETELTDGDYQKISGSFTPAESGAYFVGIKGKLDYTPYYISIDDISITKATVCTKPSALTATNITDTAAELSWTAGGSETAWVLEYGEEGFTQGSGTKVNVTANPYSLTGLNPSTKYDFYVKATCSNTNQSEYAGPYSFNTACASFLIAYTENFDSVTAPALPGCWSKIKENNESSFADIVTTSDNSSSAPNSVHIKNGSYLTGHFYLISPKFSDLNNEKKVRFKVYKDIGDDADGDVVEVGVMTDASDTNTYTNVHTFNLSDFNEDAWKSVRVEFNNYTGGAGHIVIRVTPGTSTFNSWYFDDFFYDTALSTQDIDLKYNSIAYYPNPVKDYLHINAENTVKKVSIFNTSGQLVLNKNTDAKAVEINVANLKPGIYVVKTTLDNNNVEVFKLIKK